MFDGLGATFSKIVQLKAVLDGVQLFPYSHLK